MKILRPLSFALAIAVGILHAPGAAAYSSFYTTNCTACHSATVNTCNGCHAHGTHSSTAKADINVAGTLNKVSFAPGETVSVTITGGYRTGWIRAVLVDQGGAELARSSCPGGEGGCTSSVYPVTLTAPAPSTPGSYTWAVGWYGNEFEASGASFGSGSSATLRPGFFTPDSRNPGHGYQVVALQPFSVAAPAAPTIALSPASLSFGTVTVGGSASLAVQVRNAGTAPLGVTQVSRCTSPATSAEFTWSPAGPFTVAAGGSTAVTVTYAPSDAGTDAGCLAFSSNDTANPIVSLDVSGTGQAAAAPKIAVSPTTLDFGNVAVGASSPRTFAISNTGNATLTGTVARAAGTSAEYTISPASFSVAAGSSQTVTVTYAPADTSTDGGSVVVRSNDTTTAAVTVGLSGTGVAVPTPAIALSPTSLGFGTVVLGGSASLEAQVRNSGTATLHVTGIALCSGTSAEFTFAPGAPLSVAPGQSTTLAVTYRPTAEGADSGCLAVTSDDPASPTVNLGVSGTGATEAIATIVLEPGSLDFGTVFVGTTTSRTTQVRNTGNAQLEVTGISLCSGTPATFAWSPAAPFTVAPGQSVLLTTTYAPTAAAVESGCLTLASNDPAHPAVELAVAGTGAEAPVPSVDADIDIDELEVPRALSRKAASITPRIELENESAVSGTATARLTGAIDGVQVYDQTIPIELAAGAEGTFSFPPYTPGDRSRARVLWTATVADQDPDVDEATATTWLGRSGAGAIFDALSSDPAAADAGSAGSAGAGCSSAGAGAGFLALSVLGLAVIRRRVRGSVPTRTKP